MAVSIMTPQERESGFDKFLRRLGGVASVASAGINTYAGIKDLQAKSANRDAAKLKAENDAQGIYGLKEIDPKDFIDAQEGDKDAQKFKVRGADGQVSEIYKRRYQAQEKAKSSEELANIKAETYLKNAQAKKYIAEAGSEKNSFERLPIENQENIRDLSKKLSGRAAAISKIDATIKQFNDPNSSEDQKIAAGGQILKTLNDPDNPDALGNAEANRLSPFLEYQKLNFTGPGKFIGRDLGEFKKQLEASRNRYQESIGDTSGVIKGLKQGKGLSDLLASKNEQKSRDENGYQNMSKGNEPKIGARGVPEKPKTVKQNGNTYTLNEKTGQYE